MTGQGDEPLPDDPIPGEAAEEEDEGEGPSLTARGGSDLSAGTSVSGVGGENLRTERREVGLDPVDEKGAKLAWGKDDDPDEQVAGDLLDEGK